jgi:class 3 adenylate cyclase
MTEKRKLAAILAADVVGFSRLTGSDEEVRWHGCGHSGAI